MQCIFTIGTLNLFIKLIYQVKNTGIKHHHINDNLILDDSLYVSMFSYSVII